MGFREHNTNTPNNDPSDEDQAMRNVIPRVCLLSLLVGLAGCGADRKIAISGTVTRGGEKLTWPDGGLLLVIFFPEDRVRNPDVYSAETNIATSAYAIASIPPGRYKVAVQQFDTKFTDTMNAAYDPSKTTLMIDVPPDGGTLDIEIPAPEEAKPKRPKRDLPPPG